MHVLRIDPDGTVTDGGPLALEAAKAEFGPTTDVVSLQNPICGSGRVTVGVSHDFGIREGLALNRKAWVLYGGSPIYGPMFVGDDDHRELDAHFVETLLGDTDWIGPRFNKIMDDFLKETQ